jgi:hypothetical protein
MAFTGDAVRGVVTRWQHPPDTAWRSAAALLFSSAPATLIPRNNLAPTHRILRRNHRTDRDAVKVASSVAVPEHQLTERTAYTAATPRP